MSIQNGKGLFGRAKFIVLSVRTSLGQSQFIVRSDKDLPVHATRVWLKTSQSMWLYFQSETQAIETKVQHLVAPIALATKPFELQLDCKAEFRFTSAAKP